MTTDEFRFLRTIDQTDFGTDSFQDLGLRPDRSKFGMFRHWGVCAWLKGKYTIFSEIWGDVQL